MAVFAAYNKHILIYIKKGVFDLLVCTILKYVGQILLSLHVCANESFLPG